MNKWTSIIVALAAISFAGCDKKDVSSEVKVSENGYETKVAYIKREPLQPYEKYTHLKTVRTYVIGSQDHKNNMLAYRNFYWSSAPINYELLAYDLLDGYADEKDTFKKKDLIKANKDKLDEIYQNFPKSKYFAVNDRENIITNKYNEQDKGFKLQLRNREGYKSSLKFAIAETEAGRPYADQLYYSTTIVGQTNTEDMANYESLIYVPKSEEEARAIEAELSDPLAEKNLRHVYLGRTIGAKSDVHDTYSPIFMIDGIALVNDKTGKVIYTVSKNELGDKYEIMCQSTAKALGLDEIDGNNKLCDD